MAYKTIGYGRKIAANSIRSAVESQDKSIVLCWLLKKVKKRPNCSCWEFTGHISSNGYGKLKMPKPCSGSWETKYAHRVFYEYFKRKIPDDMVLDHTCENRMCVNPAHLRVVTQKTNIRASSLVRYRGRARSGRFT